MPLGKGVFVSLRGRAPLRFLAFLLILAGIFAYISWQWAAFNRETASRKSGLPIAAAPASPARPAAETRDAAPSQISGQAQGQAVFFATARLERDRARSQEIDLLRSVADDSKGPDATREKAESQLVTLSGQIAAENEAESLLKAKGYADAVVFLDAGGATAVVQGSRLTSADVARIADVVARAAGIDSRQVNILSREA